MSKIELGPLPDDLFSLDEEYPSLRILDQVRSYAEQEVARERERCRLACHDAVMRALDEAGVYAPVLRGMCAEVAMDRFSDELEAAIRKGTEA